MSDNLLNQIKRMYTSIDAGIESDVQKLSATVIQSEKASLVYQDFSGGLSQSEIENAAYTVIHNLAHLPNHIKKWAKNNGQDKEKIVAEYKEPLELQIIKDLSNKDKHASPPRGSGESGMNPSLINITRVMRLTNCTMTQGMSGVPKISGEGSAFATINGEIVDYKGDNLLDSNGVSMCDLYDVEIRAVESLQKLFEKLGITSQGL